MLIVNSNVILNRRYTIKLGLINLNNIICKGEIVARRGAGFIALGGAGLAAERSEEERSGAKPRGRGLGQRKINLLQSCCILVEY